MYTCISKSIALSFLRKLQKGLVKEWFNHQNNWNNGALNLDCHSLLLGPLRLVLDVFILWNMIGVCSLMDCYSVPRETMCATVANWIVYASDLIYVPKTCAFYDFKNWWFVSQTHDAVLHYEYLECRSLTEVQTSADEFLEVLVDKMAMYSKSVIH